jgi:two-component system, chemotaxis family, sensor kinase Cph1
VHRSAAAANRAGAGGVWGADGDERDAKTPIRFTPIGGRIIVCVTSTEDRVFFSVSDSGAGIPDEQLPYIFERYWRGRRESGSDLGLGLYIARGIVEAHGGKIEAKTNLDVGSTFLFQLPRLRSDPWPA